jgi:gliding motility-associated-like protein
VQSSCSVTYLWEDGSTKSTLETSTPGWHWFETSKNGCKFRDSVYVFAYTAPVVNLGSDTTLCPSEQLALTAGDNTLTYLWQDESKKNEYTVTRAGTYYVTASNKYCNARDTIVVQYAKSPEVRFEQDSLICDKEEKILKPYLYGDSFLWNTGSTAQEIKVTAPGVYEVTAKNQCGVATKAITITRSSCLFFLPNAFTPNGDGLNDRFGLKEYGFIRQYKISIYNRWGEIVYQSSDPAGRWNGLLKGKTAPEAVYVWKAEYTDWLGRKLSRQGTVVLIR